MQYLRCSKYLLVLALALAVPSRAQIVYHQPSNFPDQVNYASQNDIGGFGDYATVYDNFLLATPTLITDVHWQGGYFNPSSQGNITAFTLTFWSDNAGQPGTALYSETVLGTANETFVGNSLLGAPTFDYFVLLTTPFAAAAGVPYWLSIVPDVQFPPQWGWGTGSGGDGVFVQDFFGDRSHIDGDLAFTLTGQQHFVVPEPGTLAMFCGLGTTGLLFALRRRTK